MRLFFQTIISLVSLLFAANLASAACEIRSTAPELANRNADALVQLLRQSGGCPENVQEFRQLIRQQGGSFRTAMVNNRGFHSRRGSYSLFESVVGDFPVLNLKVFPGQFFFGHFIVPNGQRLEMDQRPREGALMIELIVWDVRKQFYNFYELIGNGQNGIWFYRGDSSDIAGDLKLLHLSPDRKPKLGQTLRCSACHMNGGPIMKELAGPHNDWWRVQRPLPLAGRQPSSELSQILSELVDASEFSKDVKIGQSQLAKSRNWQRAGSQSGMQSVLRPLFCPVEVNLESDGRPLESPSQWIRLRSSFLVSPFLAKSRLQFSKSFYLQALRKFKSRFPETQRVDADHAMLVPVRSRQDQLTIASLLRRKVISAEFMADVLSVDFRNPLFSEARCQLLRFVPRSPRGWLQGLIQNLQRSEVPAARELLSNLTLRARDLRWHRQAAQEFLRGVQQQIVNRDGVERLVRKVIETRRKLRRSEISKHPRGQILEPGFRVVFPVVSLKDPSSVSSMVPRP